MIAHRGASKERTENTLEAFARARELGADGSELDVARCASGEVVVFHDDDLARLAGRPDAIRATTLSTLREMRLEGGGGIPTLDEVLAALGPTELVNIELKTPAQEGAGWLRALRDDGLAAEVAGAIARHGLGTRALISSFDPVLLGRFRAAAPHAPTGLLFHLEESRPLRDAWAAPLLRPTALHPDARMLTARAVAGWRARGYAINTWTVDDPREVAFALALGVDAIITNRPDVVRQAIATATERQGIPDPATPVDEPSEPRRAAPRSRG